MLADSKIKKISFTGSTRVGEILMNGAAKTHTKLSLELGGNAPVIIDEAVEIKEIAKAAISAKMRNCGQVCVSPQRFYIHHTILEQFLSAAKEAIQTIRMGDNSHNESFLGPLINQKQQIRAKNLIQNAQLEGAEIFQATNYHEKWDKKGFFLAPTLIRAEQHMNFIQEEFFGPILCVIPYHTKEQAIAWANDTPYGLAAYVFTNNLQNAYFYTENLAFGMVGVNEWFPQGTELPFPGWKQSGIGQESGAEGLKEYLETKLISFGSVN